MKRYIGTKVINALPMNRLAYNEFRGWTLPSDEDGADEGYLVEYVDGGKPNTPQYAGYVSWSPKEQFDKAYRETSGVTFGEAVEALKIGKKVAREGWNGKGMWVAMVPAYTTEGVRMNPYMVILNVNLSLSTWVPSVNDCLANDWTLLAE